MKRRSLPVSAIPPHVVALRDYEPLARERLDDNAWTYLASGAGDEITLRANRAAFDDMRLATRVLQTFSQGGTETKLLGTRLPHPVLLAPVAYQKLFHHEGELASARAAAAMNTIFVAATLASVSLEETAAAAEGEPQWFQLYLQPERAVTLDLVRRAEAAGYLALVVTVDAPVNGLRNAEQRIGFRLPPQVAAVNLAGPPAGPRQSAHDGHPVFDGLLGRAPVWADIDWLKSVTRLPIVLKGILSPEDAREAALRGADGIVVSNHGGRTLDTLDASLDALPRIRDAVRSDLPILLDSGIRRGTDILKALALGADAVMIGRGYAMALAAAGPLGVAHAIRTIVDELVVAMALTGCARLGDIDARVLAPASAGRR